MKKNCINLLKIIILLGILLCSFGTISKASNQTIEKGRERYVYYHVDSKYYSISSSNTNIATAAMKYNQITNGVKNDIVCIKAKKVGTVTITVKYTNPKGNKVTDTINVKVEQTQKTYSMDINKNAKKVATFNEEIKILQAGSYNLSRLKVYKTTDNKVIFKGVSEGAARAKIVIEKNGKRFTYYYNITVK